MTFDTTNPLDKILNGVFLPYMNSTPDVKIIMDGMIEKGVIDSHTDIVNDHIAFRTLGVPNLGIESLEKVFLHHGYTKMEHYYFEKKQLNAYWYAPPSEKYPRVFISELIVESLSDKNQEIIQKYTADITNDPLKWMELNDIEKVIKFLNEPLWGLPTLGEYQSLAAESEYASWVIYNRYYLNHFTVSIHDLPDGYNHIESFNHFVEGLGVRLNQSGGVIKTSEDGLLRQSSTVARMNEVTFACGGVMEIPGSYVEFAERGLVEEFKHLQRREARRQHRREGFAAVNANRIFESTYNSQTKI